MKKVVFLLLVFGSFYLDKEAFSAGSVCHQTPDGKVVCNYIDRGGNAEKDICYRKKDGNLGADEEEVEIAGKLLYGKIIGTDCTAKKKGASWAQCIENHYDGKNKAYFWRSCAAFDCKSDYLLYTTNARQEIHVVGENRMVASQGLCREKSYLSSLCDIGCGCKDDEKCVLNEIAVTNHGRTVQAFIGEELCTCEKDSNYVPPTGDEKECRYRFHGEFKCSNGTRIRRDYEFILSKEDLKNMTCEKFQETYGNDARGIENLFQKLCLDSQNTEQIPLDAATKRAISSINSFFDMSEANRNVWRDEDGQFNTARLASDATAGVVLGTVGGIVSAKIIKKKQLEKGFDVLHCTVGGQKMADYGDTFQVSYQR